MPVEHHDIVVIGAGIHGAGVAQAAAASGYSVLVLEKSRAAAGTSSRSSKLIHGGLRYLETAQIGLVYESLREREWLLRHAPDLVRRVAFYVPIYRDTRRRPWQLRCGLAFYALLAGFAAGSRFRGLPRGEWSRLAGLRQDGLQAVFTYYDAQTDDAELTRAVLASAGALGAQLRMPARLEHAARDNDGYRLAYAAGTQRHECTATVLVNAAGPWVNHVQRLIRPEPPMLAVDLVQGTHLLYDKPVSAAGVFYVEAPGDRRPVFIMPWKSGALIGTTETLFGGEPDSAVPRQEEIAYLQATFKTYFPRYEGRMIGSMAGLRVLPRAPMAAARRSRETILLPDDGNRPHLLAIYGGKLTAYRATAEKVMQRIRPSLPARKPIADPRTLKLTLSP